VFELFKIRLSNISRPTLRPRHSYLTDGTDADPVRNLTSNACQLTVVADGGQSCLRICDLGEDVAIQLSCKNSDRNDLNACCTHLASNGYQFLCPNGRRSVSYDDGHPWRHESRPGVSLEDLVAECVESVGQVAAGVAQITDAGDALLGRMAIEIFAQAELDARLVAVTHERHANRLPRDEQQVENATNERNHLGPGGLALGLE